MAAKKIRDVVRKFKLALKKEGFPKVRILVFGSFARGDQHPDSDIDLCLVSSSFKENREKLRKEAVFIAYTVDSRIQVVLAEPRDIRSNSLSPLFHSIFRESIVA